MQGTHRVVMSYIGGPTALFEAGGLRLLTDPTFDPAGTSYPSELYTLTKTDGPAMGVDELGELDVVLLSHDHHKDNLDGLGRDLLERVEKILTTPSAAARLGGRAIGLVPWQTVELPTKSGRGLRVTGTPARHGPVHGDRGPVTGFVLQAEDALPSTVYVSGDTVWYEGIAEVARCFQVTTAVLFLGAARVPEVGPDHLTMTAEEAVEAAGTFSDAEIVPLHFAGWRHFSESRRDIDRAFTAAGLTQRLRWPSPGRPRPLQ